MFVLGLTGSIGMGKTTAANGFRRLGLPVHDADARVHDLFERDGAMIAAIGRAFGAVLNGRVDRKLLGRMVFEDPEALARLEAIVHPRVREAHRRFLARVARGGGTAAVLDIPLLFETGGENLCDGIAVVSAPGRVQRLRVLKRPGMTASRLESILARQLPDTEKRARADYVIPTGLGRDLSFQVVREIAADIRNLRGRAWSPGYGRPVGKEVR